jgi:hypothetical protein
VNTEPAPNSLPVYIQAIAYLRQIGAIADVCSTSILHDDWCGIHQGNDCDCNFHVEVEGELLLRYERKKDLFLTRSDLLSKTQS